MAVECFLPWFCDIFKGKGSENFLPFQVEILEFLINKWTPLVFIQKVFSFHANLVLKGPAYLWLLTRVICRLTKTRYYINTES